MMILIHLSDCEVEKNRHDGNDCCSKAMQRVLLASVTISATQHTDTANHNDARIEVR